MSRYSLALLSAIWLPFLAFVAVPGNSCAQTTGTGGASTMTLEQVIETTTANYPAIKASQAQQRAAQEAIGIAKTAYLPHSDILWQTNRATANNILGLLLPQSVIPSVTGTVLPADPTRRAWNSAGAVLMSWQPFDFGARGAKVEAARQGNEAAKQASLLTQLQVSANAGSIFFDLAATEQLVTVSQANVRRYEDFVESGELHGNHQEIQFAFKARPLPASKLCRRTKGNIESLINEYKLALDQSRSRIDSADLPQFDGAKSQTLIWDRTAHAWRASHYRTSWQVWDRA